MYTHLNDVVSLIWKIFLCLFVSVRFGSTRYMLCVFDVLTASASELRLHSDRRHWLHRLVLMAVLEGRCWSVLSTPVMVCTLLIKTDAQAAVNIIMSHSVDTPHPYNGIISDCKSILHHLRKLACTTFTAKQTIARIFWLKKERLIRIPLFPTPILLVFCTSS